MAAAAHLADVWDWTRGDIPPLSGQIQTTDVLRHFGAETDLDDPPSMPVVERNPVFAEGDS